MNFYKATDNFLINLDLVKKIARKNDDWYVYFIGEEEGTFIMSCMASEIKKILFSKNKEKDIRQIQLVCDRCGETFKVNVPFDENGVSVSPVIFSRYCSKCIVEVGNNEVKK